MMANPMMMGMGVGGFPPQQPAPTNNVAFADGFNDADMVRR